MSEEDRENDYPEGSLGWRINRKLDAIGSKPLKSGTVFLAISAVLFAPAVIEIVLYWSAFPSPSSPFFDWLRFVRGTSYSLAGYYMVVYVVTLLMFAGGFFCYGARLLCYGWDSRKIEMETAADSR
jgi:hypothetical protein